jgi:hypothetical protein
VRRVKAQHLTSGSLPRWEVVYLGGAAVAPPEDAPVLPAKSPPAPLLPLSASADEMQSKTPQQQRKLRAEARLTLERATSLRLSALVRASGAGPTSGRSSPLGERDDSPATVMSIDVGGVPSPLAKARAPGVKSHLSVVARSASDAGPTSTLAAQKSPTTVMSTPDRVAPKAAATPRTAVALRATATPRAATAPRTADAPRAVTAPCAVTAPRAGTRGWGAAAPHAAAWAFSPTAAGPAPLHGGGQVCGAMERALKRTRAPGDTGDAARPPRQPRLQPTFIDALHVPAFALDTPVQSSPIGQTLSSPQVVTSFLAHPRPLARRAHMEKLAPEPSHPNSIPLSVWPQPSLSLTPLP